MNERDTMNEQDIADTETRRASPVALDEAVHFFAMRMACQTDVSDVHAALEAGELEFALVDTRSAEAWAQGHIPGARQLPTDDIPRLAGRLLDPAVPVVTYCWGPGCNGATRAALALSRRGFQVREMLGGYEYWVREGFAIDTLQGRERRPLDPLTGVSGQRCAC